MRLEFPVELVVKRETEGLLGLSADAILEFEKTILDAYRKATLEAVRDQQILPKEIHLIGSFHIVGPSPKDH